METKKSRKMRGGLFRSAPVAWVAGLALVGCGGGGDGKQPPAAPPMPAWQYEYSEVVIPAEHVIATPDREPSSDTYESFTDQMVLKYRVGAEVNSVRRPGVGEQTARVAAQWGLALSPVREMGEGVQVVNLGRQLSLESAQALGSALQRSDSNLEYAEPDVMVRPSLIPNDSLFGQQWALRASNSGVNATAAWDRSVGAGVTLAVLDTGYTVHSDLMGNVLPGYDLISSAAISGDGDGRDSNALDPGDDTPADQCGKGKAARKSSWHGTHVAGIAAALGGNAKGVSGVAPKAKILPVRVLGKCGGYMSDIADGIVWAAGGNLPGIPANANPARVINLSLGGSGACSAYTQNAVNLAKSRGAVVVVAAGNGNVLASTQTPANCSGVIAVGATDIAGKKASYSNHGPAVTLAAPGGDLNAGIVSTLNNGSSAPGAEGYASYTGTSMAAPAVSGIAALMLSVNKVLTPDQLAGLLVKTARPLTTTCPQGCGAGLVDANAAVAAAAAAPGATPPAPAPPPPPPPLSAATYQEVEPNDTLATAQFINALKATANGRIAQTTDLDHYRVYLPDRMQLTVELSPGDIKSGLGFGIYMCSGTQVSQAPGSPGVKRTMKVTNLSGADVDLCIRVLWSAGSTGPYVLTANR